MRFHSVLQQSFNSRPHAEVDLAAVISPAKSTVFQLTTSRRGRRFPFRNVRTHQTFNSRPHAEVDRSSVSEEKTPEAFNSRPHAEVDRLIRLFENWKRTFNSRPHAEVDPIPLKIHVELALSTHDLTQRSTLTIWTVKKNDDLSTHDLTQRSTAY